MTEFLTTTGISERIERIIRETDDWLIIISPYLIPFHSDRDMKWATVYVSSFPRKRESTQPDWVERGDITPNWY